MDKYGRGQQSDSIRPMPMPVPVRDPIRPMPMPIPIPTGTRPGTRPDPMVVDLTEDNGVLFHGQRRVQPPPVRSSHIATQSGRPPPTAPTQSWQLPAKNKHAAPSKIRVIDPNAVPPPVPTSTVERPLPSSSKGHFDARHLMKEGVEVVKHVVKDGFARAQFAMEHGNGSRLPAGHHSSQITLPDDDDDDVPLPSTLTAPSAYLSAEERDKQLQEMLSSMVLPPELGDIDLEEASKIEGLRCKLLPHQVAGYLWLKGREGGKHKGGILADDMGLGKTIQMLALIVGNAPSRPDTTVDRIRHEPETKKRKKNVVLDSEDGPPAARMEKIELLSKKTLIVAPLAVVRQWEQEFKEKTQAKLKVYVHHGPQRCKTAAELSRYDVIITSYPTVASEWSNLPENGKSKKTRKKGVIPDSSDDDESIEIRSGKYGHSSSDEFDSSPRPAVKKKAPIKKGAAPLFEMDWLRVILDEAQNIKNHRTNASLSCAALSRRALSKWCLSGTPIQNEAIEMFSVIRFLAVPPFNDFNEFTVKIAKPLKSTNQNSVNWGMRRLCAVLKTIMLRRTKDTVMDGKPILSLPGRHVEVLSADFDDKAEREFYDDLSNTVKSNMKKAEETGTKVNQLVTLLMLLRLRQACSHPWLVYRNVQVDAAAASGPTMKDKSGSDGDGEGAAVGKANDSDDDGGLTELLAGLSVKTKRCDRCQADMTREEMEENNGTHCAPCAVQMQDQKQRQAWSSKSSTKIRTMMRLLGEFREAGDEKTIVFSQFTSFLDLIEPYLRRDGHVYVRYDGSMKPAERERALEQVRSNPEVRIILISFKAGNVGLNLTCCSRVILMDLWWNPMLEAQSIDRAHRLGQQRDVHVYKLVIKNSVEERILALQDKKRALADAALEGGKLSKANRLDRKELMYLFSGEPI